MICHRAVEGSAAHVLASTAPPFGPGLEDAAWVTRVEVWETDDEDGVDFAEFRIVEGARRRKTIRIPGY